MQVPLLDLVAQYRAIQADVTARMTPVIERQGFIMGPEVAELERELARLANAAHGIACASGTDALLLALRALDLKPGDEVVAPAFTFFATAGAIHNAGETLAGAMDVAAALPAPLADAVRQAAAAAFDSGVHVTAAIGLVLMAAAAVLAAVVLRKVPTAS